jgi:hypothetical protein
MFKNAKNTKKQGDIGVGHAIAYFTLLCYTVMLPLTDSQEYDLVIDDGESLKKVQVKTTASKTLSGAYEASLRTTGGNQSFHTAKKFDKDKVDILYILNAENEAWVIPTKEINVTTTLTLGSKYEKYKIL